MRGSKVGPVKRKKKVPKPKPEYVVHKLVPGQLVMHRWLGPLFIVAVTETLQYKRRGRGSIGGWRATGATRVFGVTKNAVTDVFLVENDFDRRHVWT